MITNLSHNQHTTWLFGLDGGNHGKSLAIRLTGRDADQGINGKEKILFNAYTVITDRHTVTLVRGLSRQHAVNIDIGILFGQREDFQIAELRFQGNAHNLLFTAKIDYTGFGSIHRRFNTISVATLLHRGSKKAFLGRNFFIIDINGSISRLGTHHQQLRIRIHRSLGSTVIHTDLHLINSAFIDYIRVEVVAQNTILIMHDRNATGTTGNIKPDLAGFILTGSDT